MQLDDHPRVESGPRISTPEFGLVFVIILGPEIKFNFMAVFLKLGPMSPPGLWKCSKRSIKFQNGETLVMYNFLTLKMRKLRPKEGIFFFLFQSHSVSSRARISIWISYFLALGFSHSTALISLLNFLIFHLEISDYGIQNPNKSFE